MHFLLHFYATLQQKSGGRHFFRGLDPLVNPGVHPPFLTYGQVYHFCIVAASVSFTAASFEGRAAEIEWKADLGSEEEGTACKRKEAEAIEQCTLEACERRYGHTGVGGNG